MLKYSEETFFLPGPLTFIHFWQPMINHKLSSCVNGHPVRNRLKFISEASRLNLVFFLCFVLNLFLLGIQPLLTVS